MDTSKEFVMLRNKINIRIILKRSINNNKKKTLKEQETKVLFISSVRKEAWAQHKGLMSEAIKQHTSVFKRGNSLMNIWKDVDNKSDNSYEDEKTNICFVENKQNFI